MSTDSTNRLRRRLDEGRAALGGAATLGSPFAAEILGASGLDYVCVDLQHGLADSGALAPMVTAVTASGATPLVRVPDGGAALIGKALDAGAAGVVVPMVNTRDDAEAAVAAARYPPRGRRSYGPVRAVLRQEAHPAGVLDDSPLVLVMIETAEGVANAADICAVPGVDGVYVGPADLAVSLGHRPYETPEPDRLVADIARIRRTCARRGQITAVHCRTGAEGRRRIGEGFAMVTLGTDAALLRGAVRAGVAEAAP